MTQAAPLSSPNDDETASKKYGLSVADIRALSEHSQAAKAKAYCPYSHFRVGCAILLSSPSLPQESQIILGANIENASYPVGTCAERVGVANAVMAGYKRGDFRAVAVATDIAPAASPCGMCRQFLREWLEMDTPIFMHDKDGKYVVMTLEQLLPMSFGPEALPPPTEMDRIMAAQNGKA